MTLDIYSLVRCECIAIFSGSFPELVMQFIISGAKGVDRILIVTP